MSKITDRDIIAELEKFRYDLPKRGYKFSPEVMLVMDAARKNDNPISYPRLSEFLWKHKLTSRKIPAHTLRDMYVKQSERR